MVGAQYDLESLLQFFDMAAKGGLMNEKTAANRKNFAKIILTTVPNIDTSDLTKLDVEEVFQRYITLKGSKTTPASLQGQKSHFINALKQFRSYASDPLNYKPSTIRKARAAKIPSPKTDSKEPSTPPTVESSSTIGQSAEIIKPSYPPSPTIHIDFQIHIAPDTDPTLVDKIFESLSKYFPSK